MEIVLIAAVADKAYDLGVIILGCGTRSLRFRPPIDITKAEVDEALALFAKATDQVARKTA